MEHCRNGEAAVSSCISRHAYKTKIQNRLKRIRIHPTLQQNFFSPHFSRKQMDLSTEKHTSLIQEVKSMARASLIEQTIQNYQCLDMCVCITHWPDVRHVCNCWGPNKCISWPSWRRTDSWTKTTEGHTHWPDDRHVCKCWGPNKCNSWPSLKGQCHEIFCSWFFSWISFPTATEYPIRTVSNFFERSRRYSQVKVHHRYQWHRWQICHRCQRHRWQNCCRYQRHRRQILPPV